MLSESGKVDIASFRNGFMLTRRPGRYFHKVRVLLPANKIPTEKINILEVIYGQAFCTRIQIAATKSLSLHDRVVKLISFNHLSQTIYS